MTDKHELSDVSPDTMTEFCAAIGELILWASLIDEQLTMALVRLLALPEHAMIEPVVAQLDPRPKAELLKKRAKIITNQQWRKRLKSWVDRAEKVNQTRNIVAHHGIRIRDGAIVLHSGQLGKLFDGISLSGDKIVASPPRTISDIAKWLDAAKTAYEEGTIVIANLDRFRAASLAEEEKLNRAERT